MKTMLLLLFGFIGMKSTFAQSDLAIQQWQNAHPSVLLISSETYANMDGETKKSIEGKAIIFSGEITIQDLNNAMQSEKSGEIEANGSSIESERDMIKVWLGTHTDVKIIRNSEFLSAEQIVQSAYLNDHALILNGEFITVEDILKY